jgi:HEAT repeat protein
VLGSVSGASLAGCQGGVIAGMRQGGSESILDLFSPPSPEAMVQLATDETNPDNRQRGLLLLANSPFGGEAVYLRYYESAFDDVDARVRAAAARALGFHGVPDHTQLLGQHLLEDQSDLVRLQCAKALQRLHNPAAIDTLLQAARPEQETDGDVREASAVALAQYRTTSVVQGLIGALQDRELRVNMAASESLTTLTGQVLGTDPGRWLDWTSQNADWFVQALVYTYPVFYRPAKWWEYVVPWTYPPNEVASEPIGLPDAEGAG